ncbi:hypothetical protein GGX14DRAFT_606880 [Mycena pura]|uniref:Uncharacterized protein n=1 Tax=Mycena pura TaxID=153505 RepID=A0AAD6VM88_9AGAR|nr:hypothetical protein GGX14DRAFT_606880 [Mycena pura]
MARRNENWDDLENLFREEIVHVGDTTMYATTERSHFGADSEPNDQRKRLKRIHHENCRIMARALLQASAIKCSLSLDPACQSHRNCCLRLARSIRRSPSLSDPPYHAFRGDSRVVSSLNATPQVFAKNNWHVNSPQPDFLRPLDDSHVAPSLNAPPHVIAHNIFPEVEQRSSVSPARRVLHRPHLCDTAPGDTLPVSTLIILLVVSGWHRHLLVLPSVAAADCHLQRDVGPPESALPQEPLRPNRSSSFSMRTFPRKRRRARRRTLPPGSGRGRALELDPSLSQSFRYVASLPAVCQPLSVSDVDLASAAKSTPGPSVQTDLKMASNTRRARTCALIFSFFVPLGISANRPRARDGWWSTTSRRGPPVIDDDAPPASGRDPPLHATVTPYPQGIGGALSDPWEPAGSSALGLDVYRPQPYENASVDRIVGGVEPPARRNVPGRAQGVRAQRAADANTQHSLDCAFVLAPGPHPDAQRSFLLIECFEIRPKNAVVLMDHCLLEILGDKWNLRNRIASHHITSLAFM